MSFFFLVIDNKGKKRLWSTDRGPAYRDERDDETGWTSCG
jgi:hypothetical protein